MNNKKKLSKQNGIVKKKFQKIPMDKDLEVRPISDDSTISKSRPNTSFANIGHKHCYGANNWKTFLDSVQEQNLANKSKPRIGHCDLSKGANSKPRPKPNTSINPSSNGIKIQKNVTNVMSEIHGNRNRPQYDSSSCVIVKDHINLPSKNNNVGLVKNKMAKIKVKQGGATLTKQIAIDCEMVGVEMGANGNMLARVSLVNAKGDCIYDKYVKPTEPITDYRTRFSGIRPTNLENAEDFKTVQNEVAEILKGRILVGHALKHDLDVLFLIHPKRDMRDTSRFKKFREGKTPALKKLAKKYLGVTIQEGEHSSVQDALAAMQLYRMFRKEWEATLWSSAKVKKKSQDVKNKFSHLAVTEQIADV